LLVRHNLPGFSKAETKRALPACGTGQ
jgi:hypothetical protein